MLYLIAKAVISGVIIMAASEIAKRSPTYGSLILSLPLISILAFIWLWRDTGDNERIASLAEGTFWLVLPTLPLFLVLPALLRSGIEFWDRAHDFLRGNHRALCGHGVAASKGRHQSLTPRPANVRFGSLADILTESAPCPLYP